jgi:metallo-beta-lactamase class B
MARCSVHGRIWWGALISMALMGGCAKQQVTRTDTSPLGASLQSTVPDVELLPLREGVWIHRSYADIEPWGRVSANGLLVVGEGDALLVDTPWNDAQVAWLFEEARRRFRVPITTVVVTHAHDDNIGGLAEAHRRGARSYALDLTLEAAKTTGKAVPEYGFSSELTIEVAGRRVSLFFPGPGHARDNITVFLPDEGILFGGCLIKAADATSPGNIADADMEHWASSVETLAARFPDASVIVPGHGDAGDRGLFDHTRRLVSSE